MQVAATKVALALVLAPLAYGQTSTWVVDDSGGPGVNFTSIGAAIAAASAGDRVLVREGNYAGFTLDKALFVLGTGFVQAGDVTVTDVAQGSIAALAGLRTGQLTITSCAGAVLFDAVVSTDTPSGILGSAQYHLAVVSGCADVRFQRCELLAPSMGLANWNGAAGLVVQASRVELSGSRVQGGRAGRPPSSGCWDGNWGGDGLRVSHGSRVHVARTTVRAGDGSDGTPMCGVGGEGGDGLSVDSSASCVVAGLPTDVIRGGTRGTPAAGWIQSGVGAAVGSGGKLRHSGVTIGSGGTNMAAIAGPATLAVPPDPTLDFLGEAQAAGAVQFVVHSQPGAVLRLQQGHVPLVVDDELTEIERLNNRIRIHPLGLVPSSGSITLDLTVPAFAPPGWLRIFQGYEIDGAANTLVQRTNSGFTLVR